MRIPQYDMGAEAARLLLLRMRDPAAPVQTITLRPELIVRGSTAPPARRRLLGKPRKRTASSPR